MKIQLSAMIVCLLFSTPFAYAETKDDADQAKLKEVAALTAEQKAKLKEVADAKIKEDAKPVKDLKTRVPTVTADKTKSNAATATSLKQQAADNAATSTSSKQKTADNAATSKEKIKYIKDQKAANDKTKSNTAATTANTTTTAGTPTAATGKPNELDPNIQAMINQHIKDKIARKNYKTTYSQDGKTTIITYQNDQDNKYCPSKKAKNYNSQTLDNLQTNSNYNNSTGYSKDSAEQIKQKKLYMNDKKLIAELKGSFGEEWKTDAMDTLKATRSLLEKIKDAGFQYKDITGITTNADEKAFWKGKSSISGEVSISPNSDPGLIANMMGLGFYEKLRDKGYKTQSAQDMAEVIRYFVEARMGNSKWEPSENAASILKSCDYSEDKFIALLKNGEMKKMLNK
ncbi:MAG: hypothetical protein WCI51_04795 [Lentisphaerota bacterium]